MIRSDPRALAAVTSARVTPRAWSTRLSSPTRCARARYAPITRYPSPECVCRPVARSLGDVQDLSAKRRLRARILLLGPVDDRSARLDRLGTRSRERRPKHVSRHARGRRWSDTHGNLERTQGDSEPTRSRPVDKSTPRPNLAMHLPDATSTIFSPARRSSPWTFLLAARPMDDALAEVPTGASAFDGRFGGVSFTCVSPA